MAISQKQKLANKKNARKGGVKTAAGKEISKYNALKHGLRARDMVWPGKEDPADFEALLQELMTHYQPLGITEKILVEEIAAACWRRGRFYRFETGLFIARQNALEDKFYNERDWQGRQVNTCEEALKEEIAAAEENTQYWKKNRDDLTRIHKVGASLEEIFPWEENWIELQGRVDDSLAQKGMDHELSPPELRQALNDLLGWSDGQIWKMLIALCKEKVARYKKQMAQLKAALQKEEQFNRLRLQIMSELAYVPLKEELERLGRFQTMIDKQFYRALHELERQQRIRLGDRVPPPLALDMHMSTDNH
ncbi:MAG: hypothetical protein HUU32_22830 [Calditrichaceae bacterium]|nr:hypothetical protein [Calditrichia bacterium]NUQ44231.1 hypothetical protein [Calditrichaceae bacterium]